MGAGRSRHASGHSSSSLSTSSSLSSSAQLDPEMFPSSWRELMDWCEEASDLASLLGGGDDEATKNARDIENGQCNEAGCTDANCKGEKNEEGNGGKFGDDEDAETTKGKEAAAVAAAAAAFFSYRRFVPMVHRDLIEYQQRGAVGTGPASGYVAKGGALGRGDAWGGGKIAVPSSVSHPPVPDCDADEYVDVGAERRAMWRGAQWLSERASVKPSLWKKQVDDSTSHFLSSSLRSLPSPSSALSIMGRDTTGEGEDNGDDDQDLKSFSSERSRLARWSWRGRRRGSPSSSSQVSQDGGNNPPAYSTPPSLSLPSQSKSLSFEDGEEGPNSSTGAEMRESSFERVPRLSETPALDKWSFERFYRRKVFILAERPPPPLPSSSEIGDDSNGDDGEGQVLSSSDSWESRYGVPASTVYRTMPFIRPAPCEFLTIFEFVSALALLRGLKDALLVGSLESERDGIRRDVKAHGSSSSVDKQIVEDEKEEEDGMYMDEAGSSNKNDIFRRESDDDGADDKKSISGENELNDVDKSEEEEEEAPLLSELTTLTSSATTENEIADNDEEERDRLQFALLKEDVQRERECIVCMDDMVKVVLPCAHAYCEACADSWFKGHAKTLAARRRGGANGCPVCRGLLTPAQYDGEQWQLETWSTKDIANHVGDIEGRLHALSVEMAQKTSIKNGFQRDFERFLELYNND